MYASARDAESKPAYLFAILREIKQGRWADSITRLRSLLKDATDSHNPVNAAYDEAKKRLPAFTASGRFEPTRAVANLKEHSGFVVLDLDKKGVSRDQIQSLPFVYAVHRSAGGTGWAIYVKVAVKTVAEHYAVAEALMKEMARRRLPVDESCKDPSRLRFVSYDPGMYINKDAQVYRIPTPEASSIESAIAELEERQIDLIESYSQMLPIACAFIAEFGEDQAREYFDRILALSPKYSAYPKQEIDRRWSEFKKQQDATTAGTRKVQATNGPATLGTFWYLVRQKGIKAKSYYSAEAERDAYRILTEEGGDMDAAIAHLRKEHKMEDAKARALVNRIANRKEAKAATFWTVESDDKGRDKLIFRPSAFIAWMHNQGYWCYRSEGEKEYRRVCLSENIVKEVTTAELQHVALAYLHGLPYEVDGIDRPYLLDQFYRQLRTLFHNQILDTLPILELRPLYDTDTTSYLCYENCFAQVTASAITRHPYSDLPGHIFQREMIARKLGLGDPTRSVFADFLEKCAGQDGARSHQLLTAIGYLLHRYKTPAVPRVVILQDEAQAEGADQGGTGKGLIIRAISKMRPTVTEHGKQMDLSKSFAFQRVEPGQTSVFVIDDPRKGFKFEDVFNLATEGMVVERKNRDAIYVPFERSPKLCITANHALAGLGNSHRRRRLEIDISPYWSSDRSPRDEYGRDLFSSWSSEEWADFDALMARALQLYMIGGLKEVASDAREANRLVANTEPGFPEWMDDYILDGHHHASNLPIGEGKVGKPIEKKSIAEDYRQAQGYDRPVHQNRWNIWLKAWASARGLRLIEGRPDAFSGRTWTFQPII